METSLSDDKEWVEKNILKGQDLFLYGEPGENFWKELKEYAELYLKASNRTESFHQILDSKLEALIERDKRYGYPSPYCRKGCAECCHEIVYCTDEEARLIQAYCQERAIPIDYKKIERQLKHLSVDYEGNHVGGTTWNDQPAEDQACLFLDPESKSCLVWKVRPLVCRVHLAEGTALYCRPHNGQPNPLARGIVYPEWSSLLTAIFNIHRASIRKTMGRLLLQMKDKND